MTAGNRLRFRQRRSVVERVRSRQAPEVRTAEDHVVLGGHVLDVLGDHLALGSAEQSVAVERDPRGMRGGRRGRHDAVEVRRGDVAGDLRRRAVQPARAEVEARLRGRSAHGQVARHLVGAVDLGQRGSRRRGHRRGGGDGERGRRALHDGVGQVGVAELREGVVADRQHPPGEALARGDGEAPGLVQAGVGGDLGLPQRPEDAVVASTLRLAAAPCELGAVAQVGEPGGRLDRLARGGLEEAQGDDVGVALGEVLAGVDQQVGVRRCPSALASISAQISWRLPVAWSMTTIGWRLAR